MKKLFFVILCLTSLLLFAEDFSFTVKDKPNDNGSNLILKWTKPADFEGKIKITRTDDSGKVNISNYNNNSKLDENLHPNKTYLYSFKAFSKANVSKSHISFLAIDIFCKSPSIV